MRNPTDLIEEATSLLSILHDCTGSANNIDDERPRLGISLIVQAAQERLECALRVLGTDKTESEACAGMANSITAAVAV